MTSPLKFSIIAALAFVAALPPVNAQTTQTDAVLNLSINLTALSQGPSSSAQGVVQTTVHASQVTSRTVIQALGASTGNTFSTKARLVLLTPTNNLDNWTVQVRDGSAVVDVTGFFGHQPGTSTVDSAFLVTRTGDAGDTVYSIDNFTLQDEPGFPPLSLHFNVSGLTATSQTGVVNRRGVVTGEVNQISAQVSGTGDSKGALILIQGTVDAEGSGTQTVTSAPPITS